MREGKGELLESCPCIRKGNRSRSQMKSLAFHPSRAFIQNALNFGPLRSRCQGKIRCARDLLGESLVKDKRERWEGRWEEPSDHDASLRCIKEKKK